MNIRIKRKISTIIDYFIAVGIYNSMVQFCGFQDLAHFQIQNLFLIFLVLIIQAIMIYFNLSSQSLFFRQKLVDLSEQKVTFIKVIIRTICKPIIIFTHYFFGLRNWLFDNSISENGFSIIDKAFKTQWVNRQ